MCIRDRFKTICIGQPRVQQIRVKAFCINQRKGRLCSSNCCDVDPRYCEQGTQHLARVVIIIYIKHTGSGLGWHGCLLILGAYLWLDSKIDGSSERVCALTHLGVKALIWWATEERESESPWPWPS